MNHKQDVAKGVRWLLAAVILVALAVVLYSIFDFSLSYVISCSALPAAVALAMAIVCFRRAGRRS
jgi:hypothetical protein